MRALPFAFVAILFSGCTSSPPLPPASASGPPPSSVGREDALDRVTFIHGGAGPWAVLGYRMGTAALERLGLSRQSFELEVVHHTPHEVQFSCMADGATAATGASVGKLNLTIVDATAADVETTFVNRKSGQRVTLRPTSAFRARFGNVPREALSAAGREVLTLPDDALFEEVPGAH